MISCIEWVPKGVADPNPKRYEISKLERDLLEQDALELAEGSEDEPDDKAMINNEHSSPKSENGMTASEIIASQTVDPSALPDELKMDEYSDDDDVANPMANESAIGDLLIGNEEPVHVEPEGSDDSDSDDDDIRDVPDTREYMPTDIKGMEAMQFDGHSGMPGDDEDDDDASDLEDTNLQPDDAMVVVAKTEEEGFSSLEVNIYEEKTGNLFVHHDIPLPAYPLCMSHGTINCYGEAGNYIAVGTFHPGIEIWNLDVLDALEPTCVLGGEDTRAADAEWANRISSGGTYKRKKNRKSGGLRIGSHEAEVMSVSWNQIHRQVIASGSADQTVKLWDVTKANDASGGLAATFSHHTNKVQSLAWHPTEGTILATGSYDQTVSIVDARSSSGNTNCKKVRIPADCESVAWDPHQTHLLTAASEDGSISCWDVRKFESGMPYWSFVANEFGVSDISYNPSVPGMMLSCSVDKTVTLWDTLNVSNNPGELPFNCGSKDMNVGKLYSCSFYPSSPWILSCGGMGNQLALWDLSSEAIFQKRFGSRVLTNQRGMEQQASEPKSDSTKEKDFEAMMAAGDKKAEEVRNKTSSSKKKKKGKSKKKAHKK